MRFGLGLVVGKFLPPHRGHSFLIEQALAQSDAVVVAVCAKPSDPIPGQLRVEWLRELHPRARILLIDDSADETDPAVWARNTRAWLGRAPDAVFSSEDYGERYAAQLDAAHVMVDRERRKVAISGTVIRQDPFGHWDFLSPPVRGFFAKRVCVLGAESTGTTTLAQALAAHFQTELVAEYGREYSQGRSAVTEGPWRTDEFVAIATEQSRREDAAACRADRVLICDTNALATTLWHRRYVGTDSAEVAAVASVVRCDLYLLTGDEIPFVPDGLRDGEHVRHDMHRWFEQMLSAQSVPWHCVRGSHESRLHVAIRAVDQLLVPRAGE